MNNNLTQGHVSLLRQNYENACTAYLNALLAIWELDSYYGWWACDEIGDVYTYADVLTIRMDEIIYCVDNNISLDTFNEWSDYCSWANEFNQNIPNLKSWCLGCPRVPKETQEHLNLLKKNFNDAIAETKEKF